MFDPSTVPHSNFQSPLDTISRSPTGDRLVVAGRSVFKIVQFQPNALGVLECKELQNLKSKNLKLSTLDVEWHPSVQNKETIASAATNGQICLWNIEALKGNKKIHVLKEHKRTVNKLCWSLADTNQLLSCSQDGTVKLWDTRQVTTAQATFLCNDEVRFVDCNPRNGYSFLTALEQGNLQLWDMRSPGKPERVYKSAHQGVVMNVRWHTDNKDFFASGGRDGAIKIWDVNMNHNQPVSVIQTLAGVGDFIWRPQYNQIASVSATSDFNIHIWGLSSPFIPLGSISYHTDICTGLCFQSGSHYLVSCSEDGRIARFDLANHVKFHYKTLRGTALAWSVNDELAFVHENVNRSITPAMRDGSQFLRDHRRSVQPGSSGHLTTLASPRRLSVSASPSSVSPLIGVNAPVSNLDNIIQKDLKKRAAPRPVCFMVPFSVPLFLEDSSSQSAVGLDVSSFAFLAKNYKLRGEPIPSLCKYNASMARQVKKYKIAQIWEILHVLIPTENPLLRCDTPKPLKKKTSSQPMSLIPTTFQEQPFRIDTGGEDLLLEDIKVISDDFGIPEPRSFDPDGNVISERETTPYRDVIMRETSLFSSRELLDSFSDSPDLFPAMTAWEDKALVVEALEHQADNGDVQTPAIAYLIFSDFLKNSIDEQRVSAWFDHYLDTLQKLKLFTLASDVIKNCPLPMVQGRSHSNTMWVNCTGCSKSLPNEAWYCKSCNTVKLCSLCHQRVTGLFAWCQGCGHGGHINHLKQWFASNSTCPAACGHVCQYSQFQPKKQTQENLSMSQGFHDDPVITITQCGESKQLSINNSSVRTKAVKIRTEPD